MESIGIQNVQGHTVLRQVPEQIRITHHGEQVVLDRYTGPAYHTNVGKLQWGDYFTFGVIQTREWVVRNPTEWKKVR